MQYQGWNFEKTLLVRNDGPARANELVDVRIPLDARDAGNLERDVRVVLKSDWNRIVREIPSQAYAVERRGAVATCRVAFVMDAPANDVQRVGIYYNNPDASSPGYQSPLQMEGGALGGGVTTYSVIAAFHETNGQIERFSFQYPLPRRDNKALPLSGRVQQEAAVLFAVRDGGGDMRSEYASPAQWENPEVVQDVRGPIFAKLVRRGKLAWPGCATPERCPDLQVTYRFFAHQPYFLVHTRLDFVEDTPVFGVRVGGMAVEPGTYTHYTFRPVSPPGLPETDIEEMGHILIDPEHTADLPRGPAFAGMIPYNIAWHGFIRVREGFHRGCAMIQLRHAASPDFPFYRAATTMLREAEGFTAARVPVYVKTRLPETAVTVPAGAFIENLDAVTFDAFDADWGQRTDRLGKRLNNPLPVAVHPRFMVGKVPPETWEPLARGERADAYRRYGVR